MIWARTPPVGRCQSASLAPDAPGWALLVNWLAEGVSRLSAGSVASTSASAGKCWAATTNQNRGPSMNLLNWSAASRLCLPASRLRVGGGPFIVIMGRRLATADCTGFVGESEFFAASGSIPGAAEFHPAELIAR